jgi:hypothetical protein
LEYIVYGSLDIQIQVVAPNDRAAKLVARNKLVEAGNKMQSNDHSITVEQTKISEDVVQI